MVGAFFGCPTAESRHVENKKPPPEASGGFLENRFC